MAKKITKSSSKSAVPMTQPVVSTSTPVRNTPIPKVSASAKREITQEVIARRAYEIYLSGSGGSELENWLQAERELRSL